MKWTSHLAQGWTRIAGAQQEFYMLQNFVYDLNIVYLLYTINIY